jgi:hypothetical protein
MDPNTNIPTDPSEPLPLGPPLHPEDTTTEPEPEVGPVVFQPQTQVEPSLPQPAYVPDVPPSPLPPSPPSPQPPLPGPGNALSPTQNPPIFPASPLPGAQTVNPAFNPQPVFNPQVVTPTPGAPVVVSGGFAPGQAVPPMAGYPNPVMQASDAPPPSSGKGHRLKRLLVVVAGLVVLAGGSAAAYYGLIVPNQPANVLKSAVINSLKQNSVNYKATVDYQPNSGASLSPVKVTVSGSRNATAKTSDTSVEFNGYGIDLTVEARFVNNNLYIRTGNLSALAALAGNYVPSLSGTATTISDDLSNQWIEADQSLLDQAGLGCFLNSNFSLTQTDINLLSSDYAKHQFMNIKQITTASVNGHAAEEFQVNVADNTAAGFIQNIGNLSAIKHLETCKGVTRVSGSLANIKGDTKSTPLTIWVSKSNKQIVQMSLPNTAQDISTDQGKVNNLLTLNYANASITAPANSESVLQLYTKLAPALQSALSSSGLNLSNLFSGLGSGSSTSGIKL